MDGCWVLKTPLASSLRGPSSCVREENAEVFLTPVPCPFCLSVCVHPSVSLASAGCSWVVCEHSDFRGRQWLVSSCEITNWLTYSGTQRVGSLYPIKQVGSRQHEHLRVCLSHICVFQSLTFVSFCHSLSFASSCIVIPVVSPKSTLCLS